MPAKDIYHDAVRRASIKDGWTIVVFAISILLFGCQTQPLEDSTNQTISNISTLSNRTTSQIPAPQIIKFESAEKLEIIGTFYESPKPNSPAVLLLHQWQSTRKSYNGFAKQLQSKGFGVLTIDGRGFGESVKTTDGKAVSPSQTDDVVKAMKIDVDNAFKFLSKQKNVDAASVGIVGASYGSSLALIYAAENKQVKAVGLLSPGINHFGNMQCQPAAKTFGNRPLLLVAADDDKESAETVKKLKQVSEEYEMQIYPKGGHGTNLFAAKVGLEDLLEQFLIKNLR
jgi:dipeptidyl aminopeptidase/acylaminoacyl peptidase